MEPPQPPPPPPASPFDPAAPSRPKTGGCPKPLFVGCVAVLLVGGLALLIGILFVARNASTVLQWSMNKLEEGVLKQLPTDVTQDERDRLRQAFADVSEGLKTGKIPPDKFQPVQFKIMEFAQKGNKVTRQDVLDLTELLERTAGKTANGTSGTVPP